MSTADTIDPETLAEHATSDPTRDPVERENQIRWSAGDDRAHVETTEPALIRRWLHLEHFELAWFSCVRPSDDRDRGVYRDYGPQGTTERWLQEWDADGRPDVVCIAGTVPIGAVTLKTVPRDGDEHAKITAGGVLYD